MIMVKNSVKGIVKMNCTSKLALTLLNTFLQLHVRSAAVKVFALPLSIIKPAMKNRKINYIF